MRTWRELWTAKASISSEALANHAIFHVAKSKQGKQPSFRWLNHLLNRESSD
jgi:hypothetical protein